MLATLVLVLQAIAAVGVNAQCSAVLDKPTALKNEICGDPGSLRLPKVVRQYATSDLAACMENAYRDLSSKSFSYNSTDNTCTTYAATLRRQRFKQNSQSDTTFYYTDCFHLDQSCFGDIANPSFETDLTGFPETDGPSTQQVSYTPWFVYNYYNASTTNITSTSYVASNDDIPFNGNPTPDGDHFLVIETDSMYNAFFAQTVKLKPSTTYTLSFLYNFFNYDGQPSVPDGPSNNYAILVYVQGQMLPEFVRPFPDQGDADGIWKNFEATFTSRARGRDRASYIGILIGTPNSPPDIATKAVFGFDAISLTEVTD